MTLVECRVEDAELPAGSADVVLAMGSLQYADRPGRGDRPLRGLAAARRRGLPCWSTRGRRWCWNCSPPAGTDEALERLATRRGVWQVGLHAADLHLLDAAELTAAVRAAGLTVERLAGLLVGASAHGRAGCSPGSSATTPRQLATERRLAAEPALADLGKQLLVIGRKPA